ncbi:MAG: 3-phosphoshikimate 1-carboxyvinyltransferase [Propionicimonas sp.]
MIRWEAPLATSPVNGLFAVPGSKSTTARSFMLAALADAPGEVIGALSARDTTLMRQALGQFGVRFDDVTLDRVLVSPPAVFHAAGRIDCGLAGTVLRFLPPIAALIDGPTEFVGDAEAAARPVAPLLGALADLGATVTTPYHLPFTVTGGVLVRGGAVALDASDSSQFISALLLAGARFPEGLAVRHTGHRMPSLPHIVMTVRMLRGRGVRIAEPESGVWVVDPGPIASVIDRVEPDLTNAASLLAAAVATGGRLTTRWPEHSLQPADALADVLAAFGADLSYSVGPAGRMLTVAGPDRVRGVELDLQATSEFTPVAAALAVLADSPSVLHGVGHIRGHESDRLAALEAELCGLGADVRQLPDGLDLRPRPLRGGVFHTHADHRLAHAGALLGLVTPGVVLDDVTCTTKTLPNFAGLWTSMVEGRT